MEKPHKMTEDEVRNRFLEAVRNIANEWAHYELRTDRYEGETEAEWRCRGTAFSIMVLLDGGHGDMPGFVVAPSPHPDDKEFHKSEGDNWYPKSPEVKCDIAGCLHELLNIHGNRE